MKKFLALMIAFIMLSLALVPQGALALTPPTQTLLAVQRATFSNVGDEVTVPVMLSTLPSGGLLSAEASIKYDSASLQFVSAEAGTILKNASNYFNVVPEKNGSVTLVFMDEDLGPNAIVDNGIFANLKFKVIKDIPSESAIQINSFIATDKQINTVPTTVGNGSVKKLGSSEDVTLAVQQAVSYSALGDTVTVPVKLSGIPSTGVTCIGATIKYDASTLQYIAADAGPIIKNASTNFAVNPLTGSIVMLFTDEDLGNGVITSDGIFANLKFKVIKEIATESAISIDELSIGDINIKEIGSKAIGGSVIPSKDVTLAVQQAVSYSALGDTVTVPVQLSGIPSTGVMGVQATIRYDASTLQYIAADAGPIIKNASTNFTVNPLTGGVVMLFVDEDLGRGVITSDGIFANLKFKVIKEIATESEISIDELSIADINIKKVASKAISGSVIPSKDVTLAVQQAVSYSALGDTVTVPVKLSGIPSTGVMGVQATIKYDASTLQYIAADAGPIIKNASTNFTVNPLTGNVVMLFADEDLGNGVITSDGIFANLKFKVIKEIATESAISIDELAIADINIKKVASKAVSGSVIPSVYNNLVITPSKIVFDMNNPADVTVTLPSGEVLADIKAGSASLTKGTDYTVSGSTVKISKSYYQYIFSKWPAVTNILTFNMVSGKTATLTATATAGTSLITPNKIIFDTNNPADVLITIKNGESLADIKAGSASLTKGTDYTVSGNTVKISKAYYQYIFSKWPAVTNILTFNMVSGKTATLTATAAAGTSLITPNKIVFDTNNPADVLVTIANGETLSDIKAGSALLTKGTDYTVSGSTVKISKSYYQYIFGKWPAVTNILTFNMVSGKTAVLIATATAGTSLITPSNVVFHFGSPSEAAITIANGEVLTDIKAGSVSLKKGTDYAVSGNTVMVNGYLRYIFSKWPAVTCNLTFIMASGKTATLTATAAKEIVVKDSIISPSTITIPGGASQDQTVNLILNGNTLSSITDGSYTLKLNTDYVLADNLVILKTSYLNKIIGNSRSLVFNFSSGKSSTLSLEVIIPDRVLNVSLGSVTASSGSTVTVPVTVKGIPTAGLAGLQLTAQFDPAYVSSVAYEAGPACTNPPKNLSVTISGGKICILFIDETMGDQLLLNDGVLVNLKLTLKANAIGKTNLKITDSTASDVDFNVYHPKLVESVITAN